MVAWHRWLAYFYALSLYIPIIFVYIPYFFFVLSLYFIWPLVIKKEWDFQTILDASLYLVHTTLYTFLLHSLRNVFLIPIVIVMSTTLFFTVYRYPNQGGGWWLGG